MSFRPVRLLVVVLAALACCGGVARADTTFYEAYQNGLAREKEGNWKEARENFLRASELRPAPGRRVKSYGLNFIEPYDPALHLARASFHLGHLDEARRLLQASRAADVSPAAEVAALAAEIEAARLRASAAARAVEAPVEPPAAAPTRPERTAPAETPPHVLPQGSAPATGVPSVAPVLPAPRADADPQQASGRPAVRPGPPTAALPTPDRIPVGKAVEPTPRSATLGEPGGDAGAPVRPAEPRPGSLPPPDATAPAGSEGRPEGSVNYGAMALLASALALLVLVATRAALVIRDRRRPSPVPAGNEISSGSAIPSPGAGTEEEQSRATSLLSVETGSSPSGRRAGSASTAAGVRPLREGTDTRFGAYELEGILGRGGMGTTFVARRLRDGFPVALKVPHEHILEEPEFVERFLREGALGALLRHPNIVRVYEAGEHDERPFIAMELVPGTTLERVLRKESRLPLARALQISRGIALALDYAHLKGIVHRDLKPENVMVLPDGEVKVMDYGIARRMDVAGLTATDVYLGTPHYSAPESLVPSEVGPQSDLYSLGVILFRMLAGVLPHSAPTPFELLHKHAYEPLPPLPPELGILPEVYGLLLELTAKSKNERYASAELFLRDLDQILNRL
ncbi:MAG: protein kinase [Holophagales bacterium]|nr:protein kinase [Holophagales bacterium]MBK9965694.1 protein kinase [Holophagales bacterium]